MEHGQGKDSRFPDPLPLFVVALVSNGSVKDVLIDSALAGAAAALGGLTTGAILDNPPAAVIGSLIAFGIAFLTSLSAARRRDGYRPRKPRRRYE